MRLYQAPYAPNPFTVRLFIAERGGLNLDVATVDLINLDNRSLPYREINPFGTVPALELDDGTVISDIVAICEYLDEVAAGDRRLVGSSPEERAAVRMWTRHVDQEIAGRFTAWYRGGEESIDFYRGHRFPETGGRAENKQIAMRGLNMLDEHLGRTGTDYITGSDVRLADILLFAFMTTMSPVTPWLLPEGRRLVAAWYERMKQRPAFAEAQQQVDTITA